MTNNNLNMVEVLVVNGVVGYATRVNGGKLQVGTYEEVATTKNAKAAIYGGIVRVLSDMAKKAKPAYYQVFVQDAVALRMVGLKNRLSKFQSIDAVIDYHQKSMFSDEEKNAFAQCVQVWYGLIQLGFEIQFKNARALFSYEILPKNTGEILTLGDEITLTKSENATCIVKEIDVLNGTYKVLKREFDKRDGSKGVKYFAQRTQKMSDGNLYSAAELCKIAKDDPEKVTELAQSESAVRWVYALIGHTELTKVMPKLRLTADFNKVEVKNGSAF